MKELSIEEKAKAYDIALDKLKRLFGTGDNCTREELEYVFPELKESDGDRINKAIYNCVKWFGFDSSFFKDVSQEECLAWLEKQGEQKPWSEEDEKILKDIITDVKFEGYNNDMQANSYKKISWLKSLRPQSTWKPNDEQMHYLSWIANVKLGDSVVEQEVSKHLNELLKDLKKL